MNTDNDKDKRIIINGKQVGVHRFIMEQILGRKLKRSEVVYHLNKIKNDNRIENLVCAIEKPGHKFCTKCNTNKPIELFVKSGSNRDGLSSCCKPCKKGEYIKRRTCKKEYKERTGKTKNWYKYLKINGKKVYEHRIIMQEFLGRKLGRGEFVYHINGIKHDNRIENLRCIINSAGHKYCPMCKTYKTLDQFDFHSSLNQKKETYCKICIKERFFLHRTSKKEYRELIKIPAKPGFKFCCKCRIEKPIDQFYKRRDNKELSGRCKDCMRNSRIELFKNPEQKRKMRKYKWKHTFGITEDDYNNILNSQNGGCAICGIKTPHAWRERKYFCVDHDHKTGKVRALLCSKCNIGLGAFGDNIDFLKSAILYLEKHREDTVCQKEKEKKDTIQTDPRFVR